MADHSFIAVALPDRAAARRPPVRVGRAIPAPGVSCIGIAGPRGYRDSTGTKGTWFHAAGDRSKSLPALYIGNAATHFMNGLRMPTSGGIFIPIVTGPTASGKSALALALAQRFGGAIVNADAMQTYDAFPILTAQPTAEERA